jgi:uncharacterized Zn-finger protein
MTIDAPEKIIVSTKKIACDGDEGALGHPRVYLTMNAEGQVECPYCDRLYILQGGPADMKMHSA